MRRDRPPATARGVEARWVAGHWRFRARCTVAGARRVGPLRDDQDRAAADLQVLRRHAGAFRQRAVTLGEACDQVVKRAEERGASPATVRKTYRCAARFLCRELGARTPLVELADREVLRGFARRVVEAGRAPATLWTKDLLVLRHALERAGLPNPIPELRRELGRVGMFKRAPARQVVIPPAELGQLLARVRAGQLAAGHRAKPAELREADADVLELLAVTGARRGEFGRVRIDDVELDACRVWIATPKDRGAPRWCYVPTSSRPALERQLARARAAVELGENRARLLVPDPHDDGDRALEAVLGRWKRLLGEPRLSGRVLRRSFLTACAGATRYLTQVMAAGGHRHAATTSRYIQAAGGEQRELAEAIGRAVHTPAHDTEQSRRG